MNHPKIHVSSWKYFLWDFRIFGSRDFGSSRRIKISEFRNLDPGILDYPGEVIIQDFGICGLGTFDYPADFAVPTFCGIYIFHKTWKVIQDRFNPKWKWDVFISQRFAKTQPFRIGLIPNGNEAVSLPTFCGIQNVI